MDSLSKINNALEKFAKSVPADGTHLNYLEDAYKLFKLHGKALVIAEGEVTPENEEKLKSIVNKVNEIVIDKTNIEQFEYIKFEDFEK